MQQHSLAPLYKAPKFIIFLVVAFLNAFVDLGHKIIIQNTIFKIYDDSEQVILTAIINGLILLPFILAFTPAGYLADHFAKVKIMRISAFIAIIITSLITLSYYQGWFITSFCLTFILALQSAFYSPAKYGYIREMAGDNRVAQGNGMLESTTIVAILLGIFLFSIGFEHLLTGHYFQSEHDILQLIAPLGWLLIALTTIEFLLTLKLSIPSQLKPVVSFNWREYRQGKLLINNLRSLKSSPLIWRAILGLALFWAISQTVLATFPAFAKIVLNETNTIVIQGLLACSGIGIIIGALLSGKLTNKHTTPVLITIGTIGLLIILFSLPHLTSLVSFALAIMSFGIFGGLTIVPLNTTIQHHSSIDQLGTTLAGNNWVQNCVMLSFLLLTLIAASFSISSSTILITLPIITLIYLALIPVKISDI